MLVLSPELLFLSFKIFNCAPNDYSCFLPSALLRHDFVLFLYILGFPVALMVKNLPAVWELLLLLLLSHFSRVQLCVTP